MERRAAALSCAILASAGESAVRTIFAGGSVAVGDVAAWNNGNELEVYSDVDLYVVLEDGAGGVGYESPPGDDTDVVFVESDDVGFYTAEDLASLTMRPGTAALSETAKILYGDDAVLGAIPSGSIAREEALYLIENRLAEFHALPVSDPRVGDRRRQFFAVKCVLDAGVAALVASDRFRVGIAARVASLASDSTAFLDSGEVELIARAAALRADLDAMFGPDGSGIDEARARALLVRIWQRIAVSIFGESDFETLLRRRCREGETLRNYREAVIVARRCGTGSPRLRSAGVTRFSPLAALGVAGLIASAEGDAGQTIGGYLEKLTALNGYEDGDPIDRAVAMYIQLR